MISVNSDLSGINTGDVMCSVWSYTNKKWVRVLKDIDGNDINIYGLEVERSLNGSKDWILCLYRLNSKDKNQKHIFHLDLDKVKVKIWKNVTTQRA